jgi:hypothetical protein
MGTINNRYQQLIIDSNELIKKEIIKNGGILKIRIFSANLNLSIINNKITAINEDNKYYDLENYNGGIHKLILIADIIETT